jgi:bifunctional non-homologous end joining protein LigD
VSGLDSYKSKRNLKETPEPKARIKKSPSKLAFVVQKHAASHLHYDLRLELDGVLKSWAVPKGPPKSSNVKRLAIMVEDHPYEYKDFSGTIPKGHYGAGEVEIWDRGTYEIPGAEDFLENESLMRAALKKGHIRFILHGDKLKGEYSLIRTALPGKNEQWLWIKKGSVTKSKAKKKVSRDPMPKNIKPMLAQSTEKAFSRKDWLFEIKYDGYRCLALIHGKKVQLLSRNLKSFNDDYPSIVNELKVHIKKDAILDGEIVLLDNQGRSNFQLLQNFQNADKNNLYYFVFDLLYLDGKDLRDMPLIDRKDLLEQLLFPLKNTHIRYSDHVLEQGVRFFKEAKKLGLEGVMAKDAQSPYVMKRSSAWQKIKAQKRQEVVIAGFTAPRGSRSELGALLVGVYEGKKLHYVGRVGTGFDESSLKMLAKRLKQLIRESSPFVKIPKINGTVVFVKPILICEVSFTEWTKSGSMRHPVFLALRTDKKASEVVRE